MPETPADHGEELMAMLKRRGYIQPAYELYGGVAGFYDYGPLGQGLKRQFEALWRQAYVVEEGFGEISTPTVAPEEVFVASGHVDQFDDVLIECPACGSAGRADHVLADELDRIAAETTEQLEAHIEAEENDERAKQLIECRELVLKEIQRNRAAIEHHADQATVAELLCLEEIVGEPVVPLTQTVGPFDITFLASSFQITRNGEVLVANRMACSKCQESWHQNARISPFNLMFATRIGPGDGKPGYVRPETAQGMFVNFDWLYRYNREKLPLGAVQIGRAYRNEIAPRQGLIRLREFWQAEAEVFVDPEDKGHGSFDDVAEMAVHLVPDGGEQVEMALGEAVEKGLIDNETVAYFLAKTYRILTEAGLDPDRVRFRQHESDEMAHYAADCWDAEFHSARYGWVECVGIADRGCYDLEAHQEHSGQSLEAFRLYDEAIEEEVTRVVADMSALGPLFKGQAQAVAEALEALDANTLTSGQAVELDLDGELIEVPGDAFEIQETTERVTGQRFLPHVIEPSYGIDRILYAVLEHSFDPTGETTVLSLPPWMAPLQVGVLPLVSKDGLPEKAHEIEDELKRRGIVTYYDDGGSVGRRYARLDEVGTPFVVTVDHETLEEGTATIRDRDSQEQARVAVDELAGTLARLVWGEASFEDLDRPGS